MTTQIPTKISIGVFDVSKNKLWPLMNFETVLQTTPDLYKNLERSVSFYNMTLQILKYDLTSL